MSRLKREFTLKETILIFVLIILILGLLYYHFLYRYIGDSISEAENEKANLQTELQVAQAKVANLNQMESNLRDIKSESYLSPMGSYNNSKEEISIINDALKDTSKYNIEFSDLTRTGNLVRRKFDLSYTVNSYKEAKNVIRKLSKCEYRCILNDITFVSDNGSVKDDEVSVSLTGTFYETLVDGKADSGLPEDSALTDEEAIEAKTEEYDY